MQRSAFDVCICFCCLVFCCARGSSKCVQECMCCCCCCCCCCSPSLVGCRMVGLLVGSFMARFVLFFFWFLFFCSSVRQTAIVHLRDNHTLLHAPTHPTPPSPLFSPPTTPATPCLSRKPVQHHLSKTTERKHSAKTFLDRSGFGSWNSKIYQQRLGERASWWVSRRRMGEGGGGFCFSLWPEGLLAQRDSYATKKFKPSE